MVEKKFWDLIATFKVNNFSGVPYNYSIIEKISKFGKSFKALTLDTVKTFYKDALNANFKI